jgi:hypothetical protein
MTITKAEKKAADMFMNRFSNWGINENDGDAFVKEKSDWRKIFPNPGSKEGPGVERAEEALHRLTMVLKGTSLGGGEIVTGEQTGLRKFFSKGFIGYIAGKDGKNAIFKAVNKSIKNTRELDAHIAIEISNGNNNVYDLLLASVKAGHKKSIRLLDIAKRTIAGYGRLGRSDTDLDSRLLAIHTLTSLAFEDNADAVKELFSIATTGNYKDSSMAALTNLSNMEAIEEVKEVAKNANNPAIVAEANKILKAYYAE